MKAPVYSSSVEKSKISVVEDKSKSIGKSQNGTTTTASLLKWISLISDKRRAIRKKSRCSNLLAETLLSNSLKIVRTELSKKQEEKKERLKQFQFTTDNTINSRRDLEKLINRCNGSEMDNDFPSKEHDLLPIHSALDSEVVKSSLQSLDSFFSELNKH